MSDPLWERCLKPVLPDASTLLANLVEGEILEHLFSKRLISECSYDALLQKLKTDTSYRVAKELLRILMRTPPPSFDQFCIILSGIEGGGALSQLLLGEKAKRVGLDHTNEAVYELTSPRPTCAVPRNIGAVRHFLGTAGLPDKRTYVQVLERIKVLREKLIGSFDDQQILIVGRCGMGKSSLINSFNYVANLAADENAHFDEIAESSSCSSSAKTLSLFQYNAKIGGMYRSLLRSHNDGYKEKLQVAPTLYDTYSRLGCCKGTITHLLRFLAQGVTLTESMIECDVDDPGDSHEHCSSHIGQHLLEDARPAAKHGVALILVIGMRESYPEGVANELSAAVLKSNQNARIFVVLTQSDSIKSPERRSRIRDMHVENAKRTFNIREDRIFEVSNFTYDDRDPVFLAMRPNPKKQIQILTAFLKILSVKPRHQK